jgi:hypothetical protein
VLFIGVESRSGSTTLLFTPGTPVSALRRGYIHRTEERLRLPITSAATAFYAGVYKGNFRYYRRNHGMLLRLPSKDI